MWERYIIYFADAIFSLAVSSKCIEVQNKIPTTRNRTVHYERTRKYIFFQPEDEESVDDKAML
jgi:hypothetical protein